MSVHTDKVQIIRQGGKPAFAVIPYDDFLELTGTHEDDSTIPHVVVGLMVENRWNLLKAWRKHLGLSQKELAIRAGISQPALSQMEKSDNLRSATIEKLASAMSIEVEQLVD
jgi:DNA-binding XRE family transcriptional regulator